MPKGEGGGQQQKKAGKQVEDVAPQETEAPSTSEKVEEIKAELDDLLDEIDEVLEQNAEEFVRSYIQKGGE